MAQTTTFGRDPFARTEYRETKTAAHRSLDSCSWCGQTGRYVRKYAIETDGGRSFPINGQFCSRSCFRLYHNH